jgi:hypothetical protein
VSTYLHGGSSTATVNAGGWHFVAVTYAGGTYVSGAMSFYVDGALKSTAWASGVTPATAGTSGYISKHYSSSFGYFDGLIDDVRIYNRAFSAGEIAAMYQVHN